MRQTVGNRDPECVLEAQLSVFPSELGWFGFVGANHSLTGLTFGHGSAEEARARLLDGNVITSQASPTAWWPELQARLQAYAAGSPEDFTDVAVSHSSLTRFQCAVIRAVRHVGYGQTVSYGELAELAGSARAARAVGRVMATNTVPIIIPCHRVIASGNRIGGYSAPSGLAMKRRLLSLEGVTSF